MAMTALTNKIWVPTFPGQANIMAVGGDSCVVDADEEEVQFIGRVYLAAGTGTKTFGGGSSSIGWLAGATIGFVATATLRIGAKSSAVIDLTTGIPARATVGAAAFSAWTDLTGGTHTITSTTWRSDTIGSGTPFSVTHGDMIAICFHLETTAGSQSVKIRTSVDAGMHFPCVTLVTSGGTVFTGQSVDPNCMITFSDGTLGWLEGSWVFSAASQIETVGQDDYYGNVFQFPFDCQVDAIAGSFGTASTTNPVFGLWEDSVGPGTATSIASWTGPSAITNGTITVDPQTMRLSTAAAIYTAPLPAAVSITAAKDYYIAVKQNGATAVTTSYHDVAAAGHFAANGCDNSTWLAYKSTDGGAPAVQGSSLRRASMMVRLSAIDYGDTAASGQKVYGG